MSTLRRAVRLAALRLAGPPLVALGSLGSPAARSASRPGGAERPPRILLIRPDHLGDTLLATPAVQLLGAALPDAQIDWLVGPWAAEIARRAGGTGAVLSLDFPGFTRRPKSSPVQPYRLLMRAAFRLSARQYDAALVLRPDHWWGALLAAAAGIPRRFGYAVAECRPFLTDTLAPPVGHVVAANQALAELAARTLGGGVAGAEASPAPSFEIRSDEVAWARRWLADHSGDGAEGRGPWVAVHPGSGAAVKNWLPGRWAEVVRRLREAHGAEVVLTGGLGERHLVESIAAQLDPRPPTLAGDTTLGQLAALFQVCELVLGTDSGPLHLAAAVGSPTVRLYGPTAVHEFGPWPPDAGHGALAASLPCQPCRNLVAPPCGATGTPDCLRAVTAETVISAAARSLQRPLSSQERRPGGEVSPSGLGADASRGGAC